MGHGVADPCPCHRKGCLTSSALKFVPPLPAAQAGVARKHLAGASNCSSGMGSLTPTAAAAAA